MLNLSLTPILKKGIIPLSFFVNHQWLQLEILFAIMTSKAVEDGISSQESQDTQVREADPSQREKDA